MRVLRIRAGIASLLFLIAGILAPQPGRAQFSYPNFLSTNGLNLVGNAAVVGSAARLTPAHIGQAGGIWYTLPQDVEGGFTSSFQFQITQRGSINNLPKGGDGFAFVISNDPSGANGLGQGGVGMGYQGLVSVAVVFDTWKHWWLNDPNNNHIHVQTAGTTPNGPDEAFDLGDNSNLPTVMGNGKVHTGQVSYLPGLLSVSLDGRPVLSIPIDLENELGLNGGQATVGLTAGTGSAFQNHDILSWDLTMSALQVGNITSQTDFTTNSCLISWTTNLPADSQVFYGTNPNPGASQYNGAQSIDHQITLSGLLPNTLYYYYVKSRDASGTVAKSGILTFVTGVVPIMVSRVSDLIRNANGTYTLRVTIANEGTAIAQSAVLGSVTLGGIAPISSSLPADLGDFPPGDYINFDMTFPASAGIPGKTASLVTSGTYGSPIVTFGQTIKVKLP